MELLNKRDLIGKQNQFNQSQNNIYRQYNALIDVVGSAASSQVSLDQGLFSKIKLKNKQQINQVNHQKIKSHTVMKGNLGVGGTRNNHMNYQYGNQRTHMIDLKSTKFSDGLNNKFYHRDKLFSARDTQ